MASFLFISVVMASKPSAPNVKYVGYAYNAITGNPNADGRFVDPGWNTHHSMFEMDTTVDDSHSCMSNYTCPSGVNAVYALDCSETAITHIIQGANHYHELLTESLSLSTNYSATFSASSTFQNVLKNTESKSNQNVFVSSLYKCAVFQYKLTSNITLTQTFINDIANLPASYGGNEDKFYDFLTNKYGTHYVNKMDMGCLNGQISQMSSFQYSKFAGSNLNFENAARLSALR